MMARHLAAAVARVNDRRSILIITISCQMQTIDLRLSLSGSNAVIVSWLDGYRQAPTYLPPHLSLLSLNGSRRACPMCGGRSPRRVSSPVRRETERSILRQNYFHAFGTTAAACMNAQAGAPPCDRRITSSGSQLASHRSTGRPRNLRNNSPRSDAWRFCALRAHVGVWILATADDLPRPGVD
jgi:hypothetical protein